MESTNQKINLAAKIFLCYAMIATVFAIVNRFIELNSYRSFALDIPNRLVFEIIIDFLILAAATLFFLRKKAGLISLIILILLRIIVAIPSGISASTAKECGDIIGLTLRDFGPFLISMFFRKDGVTGWAALFSNEGQRTPSCIDENLKARNERDFDSEPSVNEEQIPSAMNVEEPSVATELVSKETVIEPDSPPVIPDREEESIDAESAPNIIPPKETNETPSQQEQQVLDESPEKDRLAELEAENALLKQMYADLALQLSRKKE